jgi:hypothetical protein
MADTDIVAVKKRKKAEHNKQYYLKRKLLQRQQASTSSENKLSEKQKNAEYAKQYRLKRKLLLQHHASTSSETEILQKQKKAEYAKQCRLKRKLLMQQQDSTSAETHSPPSKRRYDGANEDVDEISDFVVFQTNTVGTEHDDEHEITIKRAPFVPEDVTSIDVQFNERFYDKFGYACSVCDRLWFEKDLHEIPTKGIALMSVEFPGEDMSRFRVCKTCYESRNNESKIVPCICAAVRHIHVKRRASLREAWPSFFGGGGGRWGWGGRPWLITGK